MRSLKKKIVFEVYLNTSDNGFIKFTSQNYTLKIFLLSMIFLNFYTLDNQSPTVPFYVKQIKAHLTTSFGWKTCMFTIWSMIYIWIWITWTFFIENNSIKRYLNFQDFSRFNVKYLLWIVLKSHMIYLKDKLDMKNILQNHAHYESYYNLLQ